MKQELRFLGLTANRDALSVRNGELAVCSDVELHDGALRPSVIDGNTVAAVPDDFPSGTPDATLYYVHKTSSATNLIFLRDGSNNSLYYKTEGSSNPLQTIYATGDLPAVSSITSVGNTLIVLAADGLHYILFKNGSYTYLGQRPPFPQLQFALESYTSQASITDYHNIKTSGYIFEDGSFANIKEDQQASVTEQALAHINKAIDTVSSESAFYAPFLLRYCYRLYDGTCIWHSSPILLYTTLLHPVTTVIREFHPTTTVIDELTDSYDSLDFYIFIQPAQLKWRCLNATSMAALDNWADIVKSVDFFVTPQFSRIDTAQKIKTTCSTSVYYGNPGFLKSGSSAHFYLMTQDRIGAAYTNVPHEGEQGYVSLTLPEQEEDAYLARIRDASAFFRLASVEAKSSNFPDTSELTDPFKVLDFSPDTLRNIATQERLVDDYRSHDDIIPTDGAGTYVYNRRLHLYGIKTKINFPHPFDLLFPYCLTAAGNNGVTSVTVAKVKVSTDDGDRVISLSAVGQYVPLDCLHYYAYIFFPNSRAKHLYLSLQGQPVTNDTTLTPSALLEGALAFTPITWGNDVPIPIDDTSPVPALNRLFVSDVNNPFSFPAESRTTVGIGEIRAVATNTRALSSGTPIGDLPLLAFCSDGIWALYMNEVGIYTRPRVISREVCVNPASVCPLDQSVTFASSRAFSVVVEQDVKSLSDMLDGPYAPLVTLGQGGVVTSEVLPELYGSLGSEFINTILTAQLSPLTTFKAGMALYDYVSQRIIVYPSSSITADSNGYVIAMVFSVRDGTWSTMHADKPKAVINGHPYPYIQCSDQSVIRLDKSYAYTGAASLGLVVTRTLNYDGAMLAIADFQQRHDSNNPQTIHFYGSNDNITWKLIGRSNRNHIPYLPQHTFRFFRVAVTTNLSPSQKYFAPILNIISKYEKL